MCLFIPGLAKITFPRSLIESQKKFGAIFDVKKLTLIKP